MRIRLMIALWTCLALTLSSFADDIFAQSVTNSTTLPAEGRVVADRVNLRDQPNLDSYISGKAASGDLLEVLEISTDGTWLRVCCPVADADEIWISARYVVLNSAGAESEDIVAAPTSTPAIDSSAIDSSALSSPEYAIRAIVRYPDVNLRSGPSATYPALGALLAQQSYGISERNGDNSWWLLCCPAPGGAAGWVRDDMIDLMLPSGYSLDQVPISAVASPYLAAPEPVADIQYSAPAASVYTPSSGTNPLTGLALPSNRVNQRPVIVCVNNDYAARPQWGIGQADVVYEYIMEGFGITRFSAIFYSQDASLIGPIRSARLINYDMGALYDAGLFCSGANDQVRHILHHEAQFPYLDIDLDDPSNTRYSVSIGKNYRTRLRTNTDYLRRFVTDQGEERAPSIRSFTFGQAPSGGTLAGSISIPYPSGTGSQVSYTYDATQGRYLRNMGGVAHSDGNSGVQVAVENVIIQYTSHDLTDMPEDSLGNKSIRIKLFGSGQSIVFRDGQAFVGTWSSNGSGDLPRFFDQSGYEVPLKPGKTWISVVQSHYTIGY